MSCAWRLYFCTPQGSGEESCYGGRWPMWMRRPESCAYGNRSFTNRDGFRFRAVPGGNYAATSCAAWPPLSTRRPRHRYCATCTMACEVTLEQDCVAASRSYCMSPAYEVSTGGFPAFRTLGIPLQLNR